MKFYTNVCVNRGKIHIRGVDDNGQAVSQITNYEPYLFLPSSSNTGFKTVFDRDVKKVTFDSIRDAKDFVKQYDDVGGMPIYGMSTFQYTYIYDNFPGEIKYNPKEISVVVFDIENSMKIPCDIPTAVNTTPNEITSISMTKNGMKYSFSTKDFDTSKLSNVTYFKCVSEAHLLRSFIRKWKELDPDIITGWNIEFYDIPYLINRIIKILGEDDAKTLSPWGVIRDYDVIVKGRTCKSYSFLGITTLDYMNLYKKFVLKPRESYKLDYIAYVELGIKKLDYSEYDGLDDLYEKNPQLYIEYNIHDCVLIDKLEEKLKLIDLVFAITYTAKINYQDCMSSVRKWDVMIHNYLMEQNIVVEPNKSNAMKQNLVGGYVREPIIGMHKWVLYLDLTSLYPHLIMQNNISPEKFVRRTNNVPSIDAIIAGAKLEDNGNAISPNGCEYKKDGVGFLPAIMKMLFIDRATQKNKMLALKKQREETKDDSLLNEISRLDNLQGARKVQLNEGYGACANEYFRWFNFNNAESITMGGQLAIRWIENKINQYFNKLLGTDNYEYVFYTDTDSAVIRLDKMVEKFLPNETDDRKIIKFLDNVHELKLKKFVADSYQELAEVMHSYEQSLHMKMDSISKQFCIISKKKYIMNVYNQEGVMYDEPQLKMVGIQAIQSSTPQICKDNLKKSFNIIMNGTEKDLQTHASNFYEDFKNISTRPITKSS